MTIRVFGHKSPDTDTVASAIALAYILNESGQEATAYRLGDLNKETQYALDTFGFEVPALLDSVSETDHVFLVDHNEYPQSVDGIETAKIVGIVDHHRVGGFTTADPLYVRIEPVGCTATILYKIAVERGAKLTRSIAGIMLSAIISDSLLFKSPTFTDEDKTVAETLAKLAEVDVNEYGLNMLKAGADLSDKSEQEILYIDSKPFTMGGKSVQIAQVNAIDLNDFQSRKNAFITAMEQEVTNKKMDLFLFVITDILNSTSVGYAVGSETELVEKAFGVNLVEHEAELVGVVSRKKQVVPVLETAAN